jgi:hypothetical protein
MAVHFDGNQTHPGGDAPRYEDGMMKPDEFDLHKPRRDTD